MYNETERKCAKEADAFPTLILPLIYAVGLIIVHEFIYIGAQLTRSSSDQAQKFFLKGKERN